MAVPGLTEPDPFSDIETLVALPPKVLPLIVTGTPTQAVPLVLLRVREGPFTQPQSTSKLLPVVTHPAAFLTLIVWLPLGTLLKVTDD